VDPRQFFDILISHKITYFTGVPDSTFRPMINYLNNQLEEDPRVSHLRAVNECEALALTAGYNLGSKQIGMVYFQNSGLGKAVNPLTSLVDAEVYSIPVLLFIGWRGAPGSSDDPQHKKMGRIMRPLLDDLEIPFAVLEDDPQDFETKLLTALEYMKTKSTPYALICKPGFFDNSGEPVDIKNPLQTTLICTQVLEGVIDNINGDSVLISTTGRLSRALYDIREHRGDPQGDFYTLGSMGCAGAIGLGVAQTTQKPVIVLDGDGAALMQLGSMASIGHYAPKNYHHIIVDNNGYCSTGCQPSISNTVDFATLASACGYNFVATVSSEKEFNSTISSFLSAEGPALLVAKVKQSKVKYPKRLQDPLLYKVNFQRKLQE